MSDERVELKAIMRLRVSMRSWAEDLVAKRLERPDTDLLGSNYLLRCFTAAISRDGE